MPPSPPYPSVAGGEPWRGKRHLLRANQPFKNFDGGFEPIDLMTANVVSQQRRHIGESAAGRLLYFPFCPGPFILPTPSHREISARDTLISFFKQPRRLVGWWRQALICLPPVGVFPRSLCLSLLSALYYGQRLRFSIPFSSP